MKDFFKYVAATVVGMVVLGIAFGVFGAMALVGIVASGEAKKSVSDNSVLVVNLSGFIDEQGKDNIWGQITGSTVRQHGLNDIIQAIKKAKNNDKIRGIYIESGIVQTGFASLQEIRNALADFKKSGKWIVAYGDAYSQGTYYVASVATKVYINPKGMLDWHGLGSQPMYYKDLFAKFGVKYQVVKVGTFKSFTETYTEDHMSDANRQQITAYIGGLWNNVCRAVADSRGVSTDSLNSYADRMIMFEDAETLKKAHLVDGLLYADQVKGVVKKMLKLDDDERVPQLSVADMKNVPESAAKGDAIAIYYASGSIVQTKEASLISGEDGIVAESVCADIEQLAEDDAIKAVVIRVNSGGGDAYASEQIWHQISELKKKKPVVVSMGDYAASGAYYMSAPASWIVAQPNTLTGSIGIFAAVPDLSGLITQKLGVKFDEVKTNRHSNYGNILARPFNDEELGYLQAYVNSGYALFRKRVADGRHKSISDIEKIAQGRVWIAGDALRIGLVDQLGGLDEAVAKAAKLAKLDSWYTEDYPTPTSWTDQILSATGKKNYLDEQLRLTLGDLYEPYMMLKGINRHGVLQARIPFAVNMK